MEGGRLFHALIHVLSSGAPSPGGLTGSLSTCWGHASSKLRNSHVMKVVSERCSSPDDNNHGCHGCHHPLKNPPKRPPIPSYVSPTGPQPLQVPSIRKRAPSRTSRQTGHSTIVVVHPPATLKQDLDALSSDVLDGPQDYRWRQGDDYLPGT